MSDTGLKQRLAAILAADVAGYSRLMAADERGTVAALDTARKVFKAQIESHQGRVIDMAGDSVLAVFETATGAVTAALAIQEALTTSAAAVPEDRRMRFRIGVHMGDVIEKADGTIYGDGVNIAARLEGLAEPGGITISDAVQGAVRGKVTATFVDQGEQQVKNIPHPVRAFALRTDGKPAAKSVPAAGEIDLSLPDKPSIAVLPFTNMSGDPEQEYFTDGVTEDIITELSRFHSLFVIARNSSFTYKGKAADVRTVAKELGVRYILEGSIRRAGNRIRVTGQLIDTLTGNHLWAERYDRVPEDIFAVQEEVTQSIVASIAPQIDASEREKARLRRPASLSAYEIAVRASTSAREAMVNSDRSLRDRAMREAREALAIDARNALALTSLAWVQFQHVTFRTTDDPDAAWREGVAAANKAIEVDPSDSRGYQQKGQLLLIAPERNRMDEALTCARRAHELNSNSASVLNTLGYVSAFAGSPKSAIEYLHQALRVSPRDPQRFLPITILAIAHAMTKDYAKAVEYASLAASEAPNYSYCHTVSAVGYVGLGDVDKAKAALEIARRLAPEFVRSRLDGDVPFRNPEHRQRYTTFLRIAAGLEDPSAAEALR